MYKGLFELCTGVILVGSRLMTEVTKRRILDMFYYEYSTVFTPCKVLLKEVFNANLWRGATPCTVIVGC